MLNRLSLKTKGLIVVTLPVVLSVVFVIVLMTVLKDAERQIENRELSAKLGALTARLELSYYQAVTNAQKFHSSRSDKALAKLKKALRSIENEEHQLKVLLKDRDDVQEALKQTLQDGRKSQDFLNEIVDGASSKFGGDIHPRVFQSTGQKLIGNMVEDVAKLSDYAKKCEMAAGANGDSRSWVVPVIVGGIVLNILLAIGLALFLWTDIGRRLSIVQRNTELLAKRQALLEPLPEHDEIAAVDKSLHNSAEALAEAERIKQKLMDTVAHDLRSPISSIKVVLDSLSMGLLGPQNEKAVTRIQKAEKSADRLLRLINDLLDYDKFESGQFTLDIQEASLRDTIDGAIVSLEGLIDQKNLTTNFTGEDLSVQVDSDRLTQVLVNLLSNAVKFSPEGSTITVNTLEENEFAKVEIADQGPGIPDEWKGEIFERFKQVEGTDKTHKGTGLGLPIARQIIEAHNGQIGVRDAEGGGTVFWFTVKRTIAIVAFCIAAVLHAQPLAAQDTERLVKFPDRLKHSVGTAVIIPIKENGTSHVKGGKMLGPAKGQLVVPPGHGVYIVVTPEGAKNLDVFGKDLQPGDVFRLRMHNVPTKESYFTAIGKLKGLKELDVGSTDASDASVAALSNMTSLRELDISRTLVKGATFSKLASLKELEELDISNTRLSPGSLTALAKACPQLKDLNLADTKLTDADMKVVASFPNLTKLDLSRNPISDRSIDALLKMKKLVKLDLRKTNMTPAVRGRLRHLDVTDGLVY